jgi:hypothetical protein
MCFHYSSSEVEIIHMYKVRIKWFLICVIQNEPG